MRFPESLFRMAAHVPVGHIYCSLLCVAVHYLLQWIVVETEWHLVPLTTDTENTWFFSAGTHYERYFWLLIKSSQKKKQNSGRSQVKMKQPCFFESCFSLLVLDYKRCLLHLLDSMNVSEIHEYWCASYVEFLSNLTPSILLAIFISLKYGGRWNEF